MENPVNDIPQMWNYNSTIFSQDKLNCLEGFKNKPI